MNDFYFVSGGSYDTPAWRALVMCQEIGHDFGLGHQDGATDSCMGSGQQPNDHDYAQLETIYSQLDEGGGSNEDPPLPCKGGPKKCGGGARAQPSPPAFDMELTNSGQWGEAIAVSRDGGMTLFVQDFGNGYLVYTHVTWTLEVAETLAARR